MPPRIRVRQGGGAASGWRLYSDIAPLISGGEPQGLFIAGNSVANGDAGIGEFQVVDDLSLIPANPAGNSLAAHTVVQIADDGPGFDCWLSRGRIAAKDADRG